MKLLKNVFTAIFMVIFMTLSAFADPYCENKNYRAAYPERCKSSTDNTTLLLVGGAVLAGSGIALALHTSNSDGSHSSSNQTSFARLPLSTNIIVNYAPTDYVQNKKINAIYMDSLTNGNDIDSNTLNSIKSSAVYEKNFRQYNAINFAYATARGFTGQNININIIDDFYAPHGEHVHDVLDNIATNANITTTNLTTSADNFGSFDYIANKINTSAPAQIYNASWQIASTNQTNAANVIYDNAGNPKTYAAAQQALYNITSENFITSVRNSAIDNDAIFVWAAGNQSQNESGALSALPLAFPDLQGHFINVVAVNNVGTLASYSNQCGITQNYCIAAPGSYWKTDGNETISGTSFATPVISGSIAVIKEAFPYMSATQITQLLFATATDLGEEGIDSVYGWGLLNMEKATQPVGTPMIVLSNNTVRPLNTTNIGGIAAPAIQKANLKIAFVDDFGRAFTTNLSNNINVIPYGRGFDKLRESDTDSISLFDTIELGFTQNYLLESSGLISLQSNPLTNFIGLKHEFTINNIKFYQNARLGLTSPIPSEEYLVSGFSNIYTSSIKIGAQWNDLSFEFAIPETIVAGNMYMNLPIARANNGDIIYNRANIDLSNSLPSTEYTVKYKYLSATYVNNPFYENELFFMAKTKIAF